MPQLYDVVPASATPPKKKRPKPEPATVTDTSVGGNAFPTPEPTAERVGELLKTRAGQLPQNFVDERPAEAAYLMLSRLPTYSLGGAASVYDDGATWMEQGTSAGGILGAFVPYYAKALGEPDPDLRGRALEFLERLRALPAGEREFVLNHLENGTLRQAVELIAAGMVGEDESILGRVALAAGTALNAPFVGVGWLLSHTASDTAALLEKVPVVGPPAAAAIEATRRDIGASAAMVGEAGMYGLRVVEGVGAGAAAAAFGFPHGTDAESIAEKFGRYVPSWEEFREGEHSGITTFLFDLNGEDITDPANQGKASFFDLASDIMTGEAVARGFAAVKSIRTIPSEVTETGYQGLLKYQEASQYVVSRPGRAVVKAIEETIASKPREEVSGALQSRFRHIEPDLATKLAASDGTRGAISRVLEEHIANEPTVPKVAKLEARRLELLREIDAVKDGTVVEAARAAVLRAEEISIRQRIIDMGRQQPQWGYPATSRLRSVLYDVPVTRTERMLHTLFGPIRGRVKALDPRRLADELSPGQPIWSPRDAAAPQDWAAVNRDYIIKEFNVARVPPATTRTVLSKMGEIVTDADYYDWATGDYIAALEEGLARGGKRPLTETMRQVLKLVDRSESERVMAPVFIEAVDEFGRATLVRRNVLERASNGAPLPSMPTEFANSFSRPNIDQVRRASSTIRSWDFRIASTPVLGKAWNIGHVPFDVAHFLALRMPTLYSKPLLLITRTIPIFFKLTGEQMLRNIGFGLKPLSAYRRLLGKYDVLPGGTPVLAGDLKTLLPANARGKPQYSLMGTVMDEILPEGEAIRYFEPTKNLDVVLSPERAELIATGAVDHLARLHADPLARTVAQRGPEATLRYLETRPDTSLGYWYEHGGGKRNVELSTAATPLDWLKLKEREIDQYAGGLESLRNYVATGKWKPPGQAGATSPSAYAIDRNRLWNESLDITDAITQAQRDGNTVLEYELAIRRDYIDAQITALETTATSRVITAREGFAFRDEVLNRYTAGEYTFPPEVQVSRAAKLTDARTVSEAAARGSQKLYRGLRPLGWGDIHATRGSAYYQLLQRNYQALIRNGWDKDRALQIAQARAGFVTRDIMYDISARTSAQRMLKNLFWFAPVVQEQAVTWLIKIPARSYWPIGATTRAGEATAVWRGLQDLGFIHTDSEGNHTGRISGLSDFVEKVTGLRVPEILEFDPTNLNIVGQGLPTLSTGAAALLNFTTDHAPEEVKPLLQRLSDIITWSGPATLLPSGINNILTALGLSPSDWEFLSKEQQAQIERRAEDQALQFAVADLTAEGINPPVPGDAASLADYVKLREDYIAAVQATSKEYEGGLTVIRLIGSVLFPTSLTATSPAKESWFKWKNAQNFSYPYTDEDFASMDARLAEHPEEWPFAIGYYEQAKDDPAVSADAPFTDKLIAGELRVMDRDAYFIKQQALAGLRAEEARLRADLKAVKLGSVPKQLANRALYNEVYAAHLLRMDDWLKANPEIEKYLNSGDVSDLSASEQRVLEASRLLKELEAQGLFEGPGGMTVKDLKAVQGILGEASSEFDFGPSDSAASRQKEWYYETVLGPVYDKTDPLFAQARILGEGSEDAAPLFDQIRRINNAANKPYHFPTYTERGQGVTYGKARFPTPEEYTFGGKSEKAKRIAVLNWTSKPQTWLSEFQLEKIGYPDFEGRSKLLDAIRKLDEQYYDARDKATGVGSTAEKERLYNLRLNLMREAGAKYGDEGKELVRLYLAPPVARLAATGFGQDSQQFQNLLAAAAGVAERIQARGFSSRGYSEYAIGQKAWLEGIIEEQRNRKSDLYNAEFDRLWSQLELAVPAKGYDRRRFVPLYEAILFGQFDPDAYGMDDLIKAVTGV